MSEKIALKSPYSSNGKWYKGNLHTHTTNSDGSEPPAETIADYDRRGYHFLAITDHDKQTDLDPHRGSTKMTLISGFEGGGGPHILCINTSSVIERTYERQQMIELTNAQGGMAILNHPNWGKNFSHWKQEQLETLFNYAGIEIYNGVIDRLEGSSLSTDRWDRLLSAGFKVWGYSNDDSHQPGDRGKGWSVVQAEENSLEQIIDGLRSGRFYASTGVEILQISTMDNDNEIFVEASNAQKIVFLGQWGKHYKTVEDNKASYVVKGNEGYIRVECYGSGGKTAWTQPIFIVGASR